MQIKKRRFQLLAFFSFMFLNSSCLCSVCSMESQFGHLRFPFAQAKRRVEAKLLSAGQGVADDGKLSVITRAWRPSRTIESSFAPEMKGKRF